MTGVVADDMLGQDGFACALPFYGMRRPMLVDLVLQPETEWDSFHLQPYYYVEKQHELLIGESFCPALGTGANLKAIAAPIYDEATW